MVPSTTPCEAYGRRAIQRLRSGRAWKLILDRVSPTPAKWWSRAPVIEIMKQIFASKNSGHDTFQPHPLAHQKTLFTQHVNSCQLVLQSSPDHSILTSLIGPHPGARAPDTGPLSLPFQSASSLVQILARGNPQVYDCQWCHRANFYWLSSCLPPHHTWCFPDH
jgi:hypothetical protein